MDISQFEIAAMWRRCVDVEVVQEGMSVIQGISDHIFERTLKFIRLELFEVGGGKYAVRVIVSVKGS